MEKSEKYLNLLLPALLIGSGISFFVVSPSYFHGGGVHIIKQIFSAAIRPTLSSAILEKAFFACLQTISYALASIFVSFVLAFVISLVVSGAFAVPRWLRMTIKALLSFVRSIHELVWAWFFVVAIGLNPIGAVLAISIPYTGALAKVFGELLENKIENQRASLRVFGASSFQCLIYDYLPSIAQDLFSYTLYRLECAVRSSAALSFVGLGGIGFLIQLSLQDLNFNSMWTYLYFLIALVALVDYGSGIILKRLSVNDRRGVYAIFAAWIFAWGYILRTQLGDMTQIFSARNMEYLRNFVGNIFNWKAIGTLLSTPEFVQTLWTLCKETFLMSVYAITLTVLLLIPFVLFGSKIFVRLASSEAEKIVARTLRAITNIFFVITRSVPEVLWGMIFVFIFKPGWFPGVIALALHNFGVLGRLCNDVMDAIDKRKLLALRNNGASKTQLVIYGILPMIKNNVIIYTFYRWEIIIRTTIVVGFIGAGGLGQALRLAISFFRFEEIGIYIFAYTVMVIMTELLSMMVKRAYAERRLLYVD